MMSASQSNMHDSCGATGLFESDFSNIMVMQIHLKLWIRVDSC